MGEKQYSLENPLSSPTRSINGYQKAILIIFIIFTLVFVGYYYFLLPYQDDSDLDDIFLDFKPPTTEEPAEFIPTTTDINKIEILEETDEFGDLDYSFIDYIETTSSATESTIESEEFLHFDYPDMSSFSDGSGDDEFEEDVPNCSRSFKIQEFNKIICLIEDPKTPKDAAKYCKSNGMRFFSISEDKEKQMVFDKTRNIFGIGGGTALWIDGKWNDDGQNWESFNDDSKVEVHPSERILGECSRVFSPFNRRYEISSAKCELTYYFYCEKLIEE